ncbi:MULTISPECIES: transcriptional repressor LexA [Selenomonas]|uniref:LexA repressor n=1 Tax=Selenomonas ruminis TaxID=2593411 RepID=A0A5D6WCP5_9FIRM|nr:MULTISPECIES: transcriptional repressor LexA [unclassified Selenomonas]MBQ1868004.1 transcriptional repressor LexA [Selenomonas sp.]TYZ24799.1 transcriptional repressor LexA [Selenomonas sp. mPRGC5]
MRKTQTSSERQKEIFQYIKSFLLEKGYPPSVREIGKAVGLKSSSTVHGYLSRLEENGMIKRDPTKPRAIDILDEKPWGKNVAVPLVGTVTAGMPIFAEDNVQDVYSFPQNLLGTSDKTFMLKVSGESMINAGIYDGDFVMVRQQDSANDGDIVVALVDKEGATVKRIYREKDCFRLQPENDTMKPFYEKDVNVLGKVIGVYRQM